MVWGMEALGDYGEMQYVKSFRWMCGCVDVYSLLVMRGECVEDEWFGV